MPLHQARSGHHCNKVAASPMKNSSTSATKFPLGAQGNRSKLHPLLFFWHHRNRVTSLLKLSVSRVGSTYLDIFSKSVSSTNGEFHMRALTYHGSNDVRVDNVPDPVIQESDDLIL